MKLQNNKLVLLIDMDEVLADFSGSERLKNKHLSVSPPEMYEPGFFETLQPLPGAIKAVHEILSMGMYDVYICTQPLSGSSISYSEKAAWVAAHLPELKDKIIMCQDKNMVRGDYLIDDNPKWDKFWGHFLLFDTGRPSEVVWAELLIELREVGEAIIE